MDLLPLNFPVFYQCVVKGNTNLPQYNAVSVLLLGKLRENCESIVITDAEATGYANGKRHIKKEILAQSTQISNEEAYSRIMALGFQDIAKVSQIVRRLLHIVDISGNICEELRGISDDTTLIANVFLMAVKCPARNVFPLGIEEKKKIAFCYSGEEITSSLDYLDSAGLFFEGEVGPVPMDIVNSNPSTSKELAKILSVTQAAQEKERELAEFALPEIMDPVFTFYYVHDCDKKTNFFYELMNEAISVGLTAMTDLFERAMRTKLPFSINHYDDFDYLIEHMFMNMYIKVFFEFFIGEVDCYKTPDPRDIHGIIALNIEQDILREAYESHEYGRNVPFLSYIQAFKFEASMYGEVGSIFSGSVATAMSNFLDCPIVIREIDIPEIKQVLAGDELIVVGNVPFKYIDGDVCGAGTLLVKSSTVKKLLDVYEEHM